MGSPSTRALAHRDRQAKILVVEDQHLVALDLKRRVENMGHSVTIAYSGEQALEQSATTAFDLVLMDIKLTGPIDGIEAARTIHRSYDTPIIYVTAYADNQTIERARTTEPYGYLVKPFQERELKAAIEMALQRHSSEKRRWEQQQLHTFLTEASARMAETLDYRGVAGATAALVVPRYADRCLIHLQEKDDDIPALSYAYPEGAVFESTALATVKEVEGRASAALVAECPGGGSLVCVPISALGHVFGALLLVNDRARPAYSPASLAFVTDLGQRLGMALDNALLFRKAERAIRMRDDVLAIVSHDLRTPLGTIMLQAETLEDQPTLQKIGQSIIRAARRMDRLIGDLLDASAINAGHLGLEMGTHVVGELVHDAVDAFRSQADARGIHLVEAIDEENVKISCDRDRILQVLSNLLSNAIKFTPETGAITVSSARRGREVQFSVADTGTGIAADQLEHLFERFWRGKPRRHGAGLGLFIVRGILAAHGSRIEVESQPGAGARFTFSLPVAATSGGARRSAA